MVRRRFFRFLTALAALALVSWPTAAPAAEAARIEILRPADGATIHSNLGKVAVKLRRSGPGTLRLVIDGKVLPRAYEGESIQLRGIDRGTHTLKAELVGPRGEVRAASNTVTFYLWHASRLFHPSQ